MKIKARKSNWLAYLTLSTMVLCLEAPTPGFSQGKNGNGKNAGGTTTRQGQPGSAGRRDYQENEMRRHTAGGFMMGLCVGQTLQKQGIDVSLPHQGQRPEWDEPTQEAIRTAAQSCREQFRGAPARPVPTPTPAPSPTSRTAPSPTPAASGIPQPSPAGSPTPVVIPSP